MKNIYLSAFFLVLTHFLSAQEEKKEVYIKPGEGIGQLEIGQSYEEVQSILGFGKLKSYEDYLAEELFNQRPESMLECVIGFDYYIKYEHLITLPVEFIYFKDNKINQIKITSFPEYYHDLSEDVVSTQGFEFWQTSEIMQDLYGKPDFSHNYDWYLLKSYFYPETGIVFNFRENTFRTAHIFEKKGVKIIEELKSGL